jgi:Fe-S-cluster containining protein
MELTQQSIANVNLSELLESLESDKICKDECHTGCCKSPYPSPLLLPLVEKGQTERLEKMGVEIKKLTPEHNSVDKPHPSYSALEVAETGCSQLENGACKVYGCRPVTCRLYPARLEIFINFNGPIPENRRNKISELRGSEKTDYAIMRMIDYYSKGNISMVPGLVLDNCPLSETMTDEQIAKYLTSCIDILLQGENLRVYEFLILSNDRTFKNHMSVLKDGGNYNGGVIPTLEYRVSNGEILGYRPIEGYTMTPNGVKILS